MIFNLLLLLLLLLLGLPPLPRCCLDTQPILAPAQH
jgi:hypothetical protein